jgi:dihydrodipicolinate synthase/N-acetylneuraminate lyase
MQNAAAGQTEEVAERLRGGLVIPAHPLALTEDGRFDVRHQRALTRYYHAAGAGGLAVAVHTTQFEIRDPKYGLLRDVLQLAAETARDCDSKTGRETVLIAGVCGPTEQAIAEAELASSLGYHAGLLSLSALPEADTGALIEHCRRVAERIPLFGFYLQPAVGGRVLPVDFWSRFAELPQVIGIKLAPFDRYKTWDVIRGVAESGRGNEIALYTGNDDAIVTDLITRYRVPINGDVVELGMAGGLLGHWACWTARALELLETCRRGRLEGRVGAELLTLATEVTDCNAALFDAANGFAGCIAGIQYVLHQQGLLSSPRCLNPDETLSPGQREEIERVRAAYPHLIDDGFVKANLDDWLNE